jgi:hypothetical protein
MSSIRTRTYWGPKARENSASAAQALPWPNAVYNACGARVRDYPITLDKILPALQSQAR